MNICADRRPYRRRNLHRRVASNDVPADYVAALGGLPNEDPVDVSADPVLLDQVVLALAHQAHAEIVTHRRRQRRRAGGSRAVPIVYIQPNSVVIAIEESCSAARESGGTNRVSDRNVSFDIAVSYTVQLKSAEAIVRDGHILYFHFGAIQQGYSPPREFLH